ncbi:MAG: hypothetical protein NWF04_02390 [Candidatus Bathyarchaeota archaeon]|nr:hypothetical protein [Candidatus Bathyarchaeota archaeon]
MVRSTCFKDFKQLYCQLNEIARTYQQKQIFKTTTKVTSALHELCLPKDEKSFELLIRNLFILLHEASGNSKRIPLDAGSEDTLKKIKELRNHFVHDREQGTDAEVTKKFTKIGDIYECFIGKRYPIDREDWKKAGIILIQWSIGLLNTLKTNLTYEKREPDSPEFFEHEFTVFPSGKTKSRAINVSKKISSGDSILLLPTFRYSSPAEFGNTQSAIYLTSEATSAEFDGFKSFLRQIEYLWTKRDEAYAPVSKLIPWSITVKGKITYGSGAKNLIASLEQPHKKITATVSIILQGMYGEDNQTFFIIIGSDLKEGQFMYNFLDFYLSSIPLECGWINSFNDALDKLSTSTQKAHSYTLKRYLYKKWTSKEEIMLQKGILAGIGRNGFDKRGWDSFDGLIVNAEDLDVHYILDENFCELPYDQISSPFHYLEEFTVSVPRVCYDEIQKGEVVGLRDPKAFLLGFEGKGWVIYAFNLQARPIKKADKNNEAARTDRYIVMKTGV